MNDSCVSQVLNMHGKVLTVRHQAVNRRKDNRFAVALDSEQNNIHVKDIVKVIDGPHSVRNWSLFHLQHNIYVYLCHSCLNDESLQLRKCSLCLPELRGGLPWKAKSARVCVCVCASCRAVRERSVTCSEALPSSTVRSWWRTEACSSVRPDTWCWRVDPRSVLH